jgi:hypothetical protein
VAGRRSGSRTGRGAGRVFREIGSPGSGAAFRAVQPALKIFQQSLDIGPERGHFFGLESALQGIDAGPKCSRELLEGGKPV